MPATKKPGSLALLALYLTEKGLIHTNPASIFFYKSCLESIDLKTKPRNHPQTQTDSHPPKEEIFSVVRV